MNNDDPIPYAQTATHNALVVRNRISLVWIVPIIAAIAVAWLSWQNFSTNGPTITITFETAEGLEAGKTKIKHNDADVGRVESVEPTADLSHVVVKARMNRLAEPYLAKDAKFWVVRPRLTADSMSGLGTIITGAYIDFEPGKGESVHEFTGAEEPPVMPPKGPGTTYTLHAQRLGSVVQGTAVYFRGINVGEVLGYELSDSDGSATLQIFIHAPHDKLIRTGTRFWNASGIAVNADSQGLRFQLESMQSLLAGGITFDVPPNASPGDAADEKTSFTLYPDITSARESIYAKKVDFLLYLPGPVAGLGQGSSVNLQGVPIGEVSDISVEYDDNNKRIYVPVIIELDVDRLTLLNRDNHVTDFKTDFYDMFSGLVQQGLRASLGSGNMLTGQKVINLDFDPHPVPATLITGGKFPEIPTTGAEDIDSVVHSAKELLNSLQATADTLNQAVNSAQMKKSTRSLSNALANLDHITHETSVRIGPLLQSLQDVSTTADDTLKQVDAALTGSNGGGDLGGALREFKNAARSIRVLADYLESHPEALLRDKPESEGK